MYERFLVAMDYSEMSERALQASNSNRSVPWNQARHNSW